ncbi:transposase [Chryseobacterium sp. AG363]|uniref:transposase n=1 Tax=Chryseobacterium sp. AG363 TaxID=2183997 RepID=UPI000E70E9A8|nr:transposase [Chryseobacterium sp. AG363]
MTTFNKIIMNHYKNILNIFITRSTNITAESLNTKIKNLRMQVRGVKNKEFFQLMLAKLFT